MTQIAIILADLGSETESPDATLLASQWALLNVILLGLIFAVLVIMFALLLANYIQQFGNMKVESNRAERATRTRRLLDGWLFWLVISSLAAMLAIFVFAFSQELSGQRLLLDSWTPTILILFLIQLLSMIITLRRNKAHYKAAPARSHEEFQPTQKQSTVRDAKRLKLRSDETGELASENPKSENDES